MIIQYCSDLHLEFAQNSLFLENNPLQKVGDILVLAGDITCWHEKYFSHPFFDFVSNSFEEVYYVPGNHEFYLDKDLKIMDNPVYESIRKNVHLVSNHVISFENIDLFFTTLWSNIPDSKSLKVEHGIGDFRQIKYHGKQLTHRDFNKLHSDCLLFLKESIAISKAEKKVVVTHHIPTQLCNPKHYKNSAINSAFVSEQRILIEDWDVDFWIYGHHHANMPVTTINGTKLVTNQLGYVDWDEHKSYKNAAWFEV